MDAIFLKLLNMSITAGWLVLAILLLRLALHKAPRAIVCLLWALVGLRLMIPFSFESAFSLIPSTETIPQDILETATPSVQTGIPVLNQAVNGALADTFTPSVGRPPVYIGTETPSQSAIQSVIQPGTQTASPAESLSLEQFTHIAAVVWMIGMAGMLGYAAFSYLRLRRQVAASIPTEDGLWLCDDIDTPFILGFFRPRIYLPSSLKESQRTHVVAHERAHLRRRDHWWKPLGYVLLAVYWFNPLLWVAYILLCRDIEVACDEKVIRDMNTEEKKSYSMALLESSMPRKMIAACPLAFGEVNVKTRIRSVLHYKKPAFWLALAAAIACVAAAVCLLTDPLERQTHLLGSEYKVTEVLYATQDHSIDPADYPTFCLDADLYLHVNDGGKWTLVDGKRADDLSPNRTLEDHMRYEDGWTGSKRVGEVTSASTFIAADQSFYMIMQTKRGETLLAGGWWDVSEEGQGASDDTAIHYLCRLESQLKEGSFDVDFFARSLSHRFDGDVMPFAYWSDARKPGYAVVGFLAGEGEQQTDKPDIGFAVFEVESGGYRLKDTQIHAGAAKSDSGIVMSSPAAVLGDKATNANSYDVILSANEKLYSVRQVFFKDNEQIGERKYLADSSFSMLMLPWDVYPDADRVSLYFLDEDGNRIDPDTGVITSPDGATVYIPGTDEPDSPTIATDAPYYMELAAGETFRNMDPTKQAQILAEYEDLLDGYTLTARESEDSRTAYIVGQYTGYQSPAPLRGMYSVEVTVGEEEPWQLLYREEDSETVEAALGAQKRPSVGYPIENSVIRQNSDGTLVLIQPKDTELWLDVAWNRYLYTPNGRAYIADAVSRGIDVCGRTDTFLYVYRISEEFGEIAERIALTESEAAAILAEERVNIMDGFGFSATLHVGGETTYYNERSGIPQTVLDMAVEQCDYRFGDPGMITDTIREARLDCDWLDAPLYAGEQDLPRLREILKNAEFGYVGSCGYGAKLSLTFTGGEKMTVFKGCDGCDTVVFGSYGGYFIGDKETVEFWEMFGLDPDTKERLNGAPEDAASAVMQAFNSHTWKGATFYNRNLAPCNVVFGSPDTVTKIGQVLSSARWEYVVAPASEPEWEDLIEMYPFVFYDRDGLVRYGGPMRGSTKPSMEEAVWYRAPGVFEAMQTATDTVIPPDPNPLAEQTLDAFRAVDQVTVELDYASRNMRLAMTLDNNDPLLATLFDTLSQSYAWEDTGSSNPIATDPWGDPKLEYFLRIYDTKEATTGITFYAGSELVNPSGAAGENNLRLTLLPTESRTNAAQTVYDWFVAGTPGRTVTLFYGGMTLDITGAANLQPQYTAFEDHHFLSMDWMPDAQITVRDPDMHEAYVTADGEKQDAYPQWGICLLGNTRDKIRFSDDMDRTFAITEEMDGICHLESSLWALRFDHPVETLFMDVTTYEVGAWTAAIPKVYEPLLQIETNAESYVDGENLLVVREKASVEASVADTGSAEGVGYIFGITVMDQADFEAYLRYDYPGCDVFAKDDTGHYFCMTYATDVQLYRSGGIFPPEDWAQWEELNALGYKVCADFIARNGLTQYTRAEARSMEFLYDSRHDYIEFYPYFTFDGSTAEAHTLVLSQPAKQGDGGIWCVEQEIDVYGRPYFCYPAQDVPAAEYYAALQAECDAGQHPELLTPMGAARAWAEVEWSHIKLADGSFKHVYAIAGDYIAANVQMHEVIPALLNGRDVEESAILEMLEKWGNRTWGVLGRNYYGSDWWTPLNEALRRVATGEDQAYRDKCMISFARYSYGRYADAVAECLQWQRLADPDTFDQVLGQFDKNEQAFIESLLKKVP